MIFPSTNARPAGFTLVELIVGMGVFGIFSAGLMLAWTALQANAVNAATYSHRQSDQMRVIDYLKRDIRRASAVEIYNGATIVAGSNPGTELQLTMPDYYADAREEDNAIGSSTPNIPALSGTTVSYGGTMLVRYYVAGGAIIRDEEGILRPIADANGAFVLSFRWETNGDVLSQIFYNQPLSGSGGQALRRQVDIACRQRSDLQASSGAF